MNKIITLFTAVVATGLMWLTIKGAHALTGSVPITLVLAALVVLQWASARRALQAVQGGRDQAGRWRWPRATGYVGLWLVSATVTVSFVGGELYELFSARSAATSRFEAEQSTLRTRARELQEALRSVSSVAEQYAAHAKAMADVELHQGGSCSVSMGNGPGEIRAFRQSDAVSAQTLVEQLKPQLSAANSALAAVQHLHFDGPVADLRQQLSQAGDDLNGLAISPMWEQLAAFAAAGEQAASRIQIGKTEYNCVDQARALLLAQLKRAAEAAAKLKPLAAVQLLDHADSRGIAQATLVRTWAGVLGWLPKSLWAGKPLLDSNFRLRYAMSDEAVLSASNLPLALAWVLEFILIGLLAVAAPGKTFVEKPATVDRLNHWVAGKLRQRAGLVGELAQALTGPLHQELATRAPYFNREVIFADEAMEERACTVAPWYRPWGARDIVAIPITRYAAVRAARELWRAGLLRRLASGIDTSQLLRDGNLAGVMHAVGGAVPETVWEVYQVNDDQFARWLLSQPVEARALLGAAA